MKTRQEMVYDFMVALSANPAIFQEWTEHPFELGSYSAHVKALAEEMAHKYLAEVLV